MDAIEYNTRIQCECPSSYSTKFNTGGRWQSSPFDGKAIDLFADDWTILGPEYIGSIERGQVLLYLLPKFETFLVEPNQGRH